MKSEQQKTIKELVDKRNEEKFIFTAGPASLLPENLTGLRPCFGRGDQDYAAVESFVLQNLLKMTGQKNIARLQGSASLALEIMSLNFLYGRVLIIDSGYYSDRLKLLALSAQKREDAITEVISVPWNEMASFSEKVDWIWACPTETSMGLKIPIEDLSKMAKKSDAYLMLDATASIGLEDHHELADVIAYSSCKGLFGLTGAAFIAFNKPPKVEVDSFYLNLQNHLDKKMTGPYHAICSLLDVLPRHDEFKMAVQENKKAFLKKMERYLSFELRHQPLLCTYVDCKIEQRSPHAILYYPRSNLKGSVVCHLGEVHLGASAEGNILNALTIKPLVSENFLGGAV